MTIQQAGSLLKNEKMTQQGREKREQAGRDDNDY
jgi:hypothetical protein